MASYHSPLTKSPIQSLYPSPPIHKHQGKLAHQAQDTYKALRRIAAPSAPPTVPPRLRPCIALCRTACPRIASAMCPPMLPPMPLPSPLPPLPLRLPPARHHTPTHSACGTATTHCRRFWRHSNTSQGHAEGFGR